MVTEGWLRQEWKRMGEGREGTSYWNGRVVRWNSKAIVDYTRCRTGKGKPT